MKNYSWSLVLVFLAVGCSNGEVEWDATGTFEATEVTVSAEENGQIEWLKLVDGQLLAAGEEVGLIDTVQLDLMRRQLIASRSASEARRQDLAKQIAATEQQIEWQTSEKVRFEKLFKQNAATQKQVDDIVNQIAVLKKQLVAQQSTIENANQSVTDDGRALEIQIDQIVDRLTKCHITSPLKGTVLVRFAEGGEFAAVGKPLFTLADMDDVYLRAYITADLLTKMQLGQKVYVYSDFGADGQRKYDGTVEWISSRAEFTPKTIQTRDERANLVYAVKIAVKNDGYLKIGMYGQMKIEGDE